jgi:CubicO group peptidase (beta-lactamase class C family)
VRRAVPGCLLLALALAACAALPTPEGIEHGARQFERELRDLERDGFAGQVLVARGEQVLLMSGYGRMGLDDPRPVADNAVMPLASITKAFTASAVFRLAAEGRLALDDELSDHLDLLEAPWSELPIDALLTHSAGLPAEIRRRDQGDEHRFEPVERDELLERVQQFRPDHAPGAGFEYGNINYGLLVVLIEQVAEQAWEEFLAGSVLAPAGVNDIGVLLPGWHASDLVRARDDTNDFGHWLERPRLADGLGYNVRGAGDLLARPSGILAWWHAMRHGLWLSEPWLERWLEPQVREPDGSHYGYGLHFRPTPWGTAIGHTGEEAGFTVEFAWYPDLDLLVYINSAHAGHPADLLHARLQGLLAAD